MKNSKASNDAKIQKIPKFLFKLYNIVNVIQLLLNYKES